MTDNKNIFANANAKQWYNTKNIYDLILQCEQMPGSIYSEIIIPLLRATERFRLAAKPTEYWTWLRNNHTPEAKLLENLSNLWQALNAAEQAKKANTTIENKEHYQLLCDAIVYCKKSISNRLAELDPADKFVKFYKQIMV